MPADLTLDTTGSLPCLLSVPEEQKHLLPLLVFLHGYEEGAPADIREALTLHGPLSPHAPADVRDRFIIVAPQLPTCGDVWSLHAEDVVSLVRRVQKAHGADPSRAYLTGFSFGGNGVFDLALAGPEVWSAIWAVDPTRVPIHDPAIAVWLSSGEISRRREQGFIDRLRLQRRSDAPSGRRVFEDQGLDHVGTARVAYADNAIYDWLLRQ
jgi:predicted peptidase